MAKYICKDCALKRRIERMEKRQKHFIRILRKFYYFNEKFDNYVDLRLHETDAEPIRALLCDESAQ